MLTWADPATVPACPWRIRNSSRDSVFPSYGADKFDPDLLVTVCKALGQGAWRRVVECVGLVGGFWGMVTVYCYAPV